MKRSESKEILVCERREVMLSLALHRAAIPYLHSDWERVKPIIQANLDRYAETPRAPLATGWVMDWQVAVNLGAEAVAEIALTPGERGNDLRQMTPLAGVLPQDERLRVINSLRAAQSQNAI